MTVEAIAQVQARIGQIASRFEAGPSFAATLAAAQAPAITAATAGAATAAPATTAAVATVTPAAAPAASGLAGTTPAAGTAATAWARGLPAAAQRWLPQIQQAARRHGLDPRLLAALVRQESGFDAGARSHAGAMGLTQLMPGTARELGVDPSDPVANLDGGAKYLRQQLDRFGSVPLALAAYNAGPGRVAAAGGVPAISETQNYVRKVTGFYADLKARS